MDEFTIDKKIIKMYLCDTPNCPAVYINAYMDNSSELFLALQKLGAKNFDLIAITGLSWDSDMAPWDAPAISKNDTPCIGGADKYLITLKQIVKRVEEKKPQPMFRAISGYSLAGLFALYAIYKTDIFNRVSSASGSLWFPRFVEFVKTHNFMQKPEKIFLSLGDKESNTRNKFLKCVGNNTQEIFNYYQELGLDVTFCLNEGNHYKDAQGRMARAIMSILDN